MKDRKDKFVKMLNESNDNKVPKIDIDKLGTYVGLLHKKISEDTSTPDGYLQIVELVLAMIHFEELPESFDLAVQDFCDDAFEPYNEEMNESWEMLSEEEKDFTLSEEINEGERAWTINETYKLARVAPWCFDENGVMIKEEFNDLWNEVYESDYDGDGDPDDILAAASKKSLNKSTKNIKSAAKHTVTKKYDKHAGLSKQQIRDGYIKCPPGTPGGGKIRKKGECSKRTKPEVTRQHKKTAMKSKSAIKQGAKKAARTKKSHPGRRER